MLKQGLENEIKNLNKEKDESTSKSASTAQALAQAEKDIAVEKQGLAEDEKYLRDLKRDCQSRAGEFEVEAKDNQAELKALEAAKAILLKKFAAFVQVRARVAVRDKEIGESKTAKADLEGKLDKVNARLEKSES